VHLTFLPDLGFQSESSEVIYDSRSNSLTDGDSNFRLQYLICNLERWYAKRANSHTVEVSGASHSVYTSRPKEVAALIEEAATHAR
jgi:hypothetical protein